MYSFLLTNQIITNFSLLMNWFMHTTFQCKNCMKPLTKVKTYILNLCYLCFFMMQSEKAQLISCFGNDYCIPTALFKTISNLKVKTILYFLPRQDFASCDLAFSKLPYLKEKKVRYDPLCFIVVSLSVSLSGVVNFAFERKLRTYALRIFHSILIRTYVRA